VNNTETKKDSIMK